MSRNSGLTLIELIVSVSITLMISGALLNIFMSNVASKEFVTGQNDAEAQARQPMDTLVDHLRNAQAVKSEDYAVIKSGTISSVQYYASNDSTDVVRYFLDGTDLKRTYATVTNVVMSNVQTLEFRYFKSSESSPRYYTDTVPTDDPNAPSSDELDWLARIEVEVTANVDGFSRVLVGNVRLRNSPFKKRL